MGSTEGPLVSFCVKCYNQERYIGEALEGAFAQTCRPLLMPFAAKLEDWLL